MLTSLLPKIAAGERNHPANVFVGDEGIGEKKLFHLAHEGFGADDALLGGALIGGLKDRLELRLNLAEELGDRFVLILHFHVRL